MTLAGVAAIAFFLLVALPRPAIPLIDGDVWWHIRAGNEILADQRVPTTDGWSIVGAGQPWVSQDWLSNVVLALGYGLGEWGPTALSLLFSALVVSTLWLLWKAIGIRRPATGWLSRIAWLAVGLTVAGPVVGVRVQVVDLPLAAAALLVMWSYIADPRPVKLAWLPAIAVAWANLHAGWVLLFLFGAAVLVGELADRLMRRSSEQQPLSWQRMGWLGTALLVSFATIAINPNGADLYLYPLQTSGIAAHRDFLAEWSPPDIASLPGQLLAAFVVIGVAPALLLGWRRMRTADALLLIGLTVMAATAARFLLVAGPIGAAIVAFTLAPILASSRVGRNLAPTLRRMAQSPRSRRAAAINAALIGLIAIVGVAVTLARVSPDAQREAIAEHMPVAAVDWIVANKPGDRPFNTYSWGGYLGIRRPDTLVYIDGRSDIYGDAPIRSYADAISLRTDPEALLDQHAIDHVLFNTEHPFADWLNASPDWSRAYTDPMASVWVRNEGDGG